MKESENNLGKALQEGEEGDSSVKGALQGAPDPPAIWKWGTDAFIAQFEVHNLHEARSCHSFVGL